ncbi:hypothetical protein [Actinocrispum sp. NPDC049592]|uniref:hypothetical protein n=1 Tax=Actinocrispum sp. NPDC049592 TaxID=3154835 RepID=UPI003423A0A5
MKSPADVIDDPQALARIEAFRGIWDVGLIRGTPLARLRAEPGQRVAPGTWVRRRSRF